MNNNNLRVIDTARSIQAINDALIKGYQPLVKPVVASPEIKTKFAIVRNKETGRYEVLNDFRAPGYRNEALKEIIIPFTNYYPYHFENPFAAYLIPKDIQIGERVYLDDLIEDVIGSSWNQGDTYRLQSCEAVWNGKEFVLDNRPSPRATIIG